MINQIEEQKKIVAEYAVNVLVDRKEIFDGMKIGLGTGSTALPAVRHIARLMDEGKLKKIFAVPTSFQTAIECEKLGIPIYSLNSKVINGSLDLTIDGADQIDEKKYLIKGGGAALLREKIIAYNSKKFVVIADSRKLTDKLGYTFCLPIEIIPEARVSIIKKLEADGVEVVLREGVKKMGPVITDNGNFILDVKWPQSYNVNPEKLENELNAITGVVENGFFTKNIPEVFISKADGNVTIL